MFWRICKLLFSDFDKVILPIALLVQIVQKQMIRHLIRSFLCGLQLKSSLLLKYEGIKNVAQVTCKRHKYFPLMDPDELG